MAAIKTWLSFCCCCCGTCRIYCNRLVLSHGIAQFTYRASIHQTGSSSGERNDNFITIIFDNWIRAFSHQSPTQSQAHRRRLRGSGGSKREMANHFSQCTFEIGSASGWNENKTARSLSGCANAVLIDLSRKVTSRTKPLWNRASGWRSRSNGRARRNDKNREQLARIMMQSNNKINCTKKTSRE